MYSASSRPNLKIMFNFREGIYDSKRKYKNQALKNATFELKDNSILSKTFTFIFAFLLLKLYF